MAQRVARHLLRPTLVFRPAPAGQPLLPSARADEEPAGRARVVCLREPIRKRLVEDRPAPIPVRQIRRQPVEQGGQDVVGVEAGGRGNFDQCERLERGGHDLEHLPRRRVSSLVGKMPLEKRRVKPGQAGRQRVEVGKVVGTRFQPRERLFGPEEVASAVLAQTADGFLFGDPARLQTLV